jgi:hypothetical protein
MDPVSNERGSLALRIAASVAVVFLMAVVVLVVTFWWHLRSLPDAFRLPTTAVRNKLCVIRLVYPGEPYFCVGIHHLLPVSQPYIVQKTPNLTPNLDSSRGERSAPFTNRTTRAYPGDSDTPTCRH